MRKLHCCFFLKTRPRGEALRDDTRNHKHTHLVLLPMKTQRVMLTKQPRPKTPSTGAVTQCKHQLYKRTKSNPAHRPSISLVLHDCILQGSYSFELFKFHDIFHDLRFKWNKHGGEKATVHRRLFLNIYSLEFCDIWHNFSFYRILSNDNFKMEVKQMRTSFCALIRRRTIQMV